MIKRYIQTLISFILFFSLISCRQTEDGHVTDGLSTSFSASVYGVTSATSNADRITHATLFLVDAKKGVFIDRREGVVSIDGAEVQLNATVPVNYAGKEIEAYFIANAEDLSDQLDLKPGASFDVTRLSSLVARDLLNGASPRFPMSAKIIFQAGGTTFPEVKFDRSFAKVYIAPSADLDNEQQQAIRIVSVEMVTPCAGGYLFHDAIVSERGTTQALEINKTLDEVNNKTLCYLYPDEEGAHLIVTLRNDVSGKVMSRRVVVRPRKNTAHKLTIVTLPNGDTDCSVTVTGWDEDIQLPETNVDASSEINVEEGIDLINNSEIYYYYNLLNAQEKELYRSIFHQTNNFSETPPPGGRLEVQLASSMQGIFDKETFNKVTSYLCNDMPVLFNSPQPIPFRLDYAQKVITYRIGFYADRSVYDMRTTLMIKAAREFLNTLEPGKNEFEIVKNVHDKFLRSVTYGGMMSALGGNIIGGLVDKKVVCAGYANTFQYLLQRCGIQAIGISGDAMTGTGPTPHGWNIVRIDGKYYYVDSTWDDGNNPYDPSLLHYGYFLKSEATMSKTHQQKMKIPIPNCPEDYPLIIK